MVLRRAMDSILPAEIQWRGDKSNLGPNFCHTLLTFEREHLDEVILRDSQCIEAYVNIIALREAYRRFVSQKSTDEDAMAIWKAVTLALWLKFADLQRTNR